MANLTFRSILSRGSRRLGDNNLTPDVFDVFFDDINLSGFVNLPALLIVAARGVKFEKNFITVNAPNGVTSQSYEEAQEEDYFVSNMLRTPETSNTTSENGWTLQIHRIGSDKLRATGNVLGIHTRNKDGETEGGRDNFDVARIFLLYFGSEGSNLSSITSGLTM